MVNDHFHLIEKWLQNQSLDPLTSLLDITEFRIDLYESEQEYFIEVLLPSSTENIFLLVEDKTLHIQINTNLNNILEEKNRSILFPIDICNKVLKTDYPRSILEISISKNKYLPTHQNSWQIKC
ncbi:Hsp20/alpha crystallin family protein [Bacillus sp. B1-b2]|nr:Hsp20/alpha crystallin family protein [Bacillus sp. B1-b2]